MNCESPWGVTPNKYIFAERIMNENYRGIRFIGYNHSKFRFLRNTPVAFYRDKISRIQVEIYNSQPPGLVNVSSVHTRRNYKISHKKLRRRHFATIARQLYASLQWRHNKHDGVSNHQPRDCLFSRLFRSRSKKTSKLRITGLCEGNSPLTGEFPAQRASNAENVSIWWRHHVLRWW